MKDEQKMINPVGGNGEYEYIIAIGISTGGPKLLNHILPQLDKELSATYIVVQHMPPGFTKPLADRLNAISKVEVKEAEDGEKLKKGTVYIAPAGQQLKIVNPRLPQVRLTDEPAYKGHRPSANVMIRSLAELSHSKKKFMAIILTGMGSDGQEGVMELKQKQKCIVIAQDQKSSTVYGMPKAIVEAGLADYVGNAKEILEIINRIVRCNHGC